jgi:hypothetical protein
METNNNLSLINNPLRFPPLHQSRALYKSALFMQNKPNFNKHQNSRKYGYSKGLQKYSTLWTRPKQTQSNPIPKLLFAALYESGEGNSWRFKVIMVQTMALKRLNYVVKRLNAKSRIGGL